MKKIIILLLLLLLPLSSCSTTSKTEKKGNSKDEVITHPTKKEDNSKDEAVTHPIKDNSKDEAVTHPIKDENNSKDEAVTHPIKDDDKGDEKKPEEDKKSDKLTKEDKIKINSDITSFLKLKGKERLDKIDELLKIYPKSDILYYYKAKFYYDLKDNDNSLFNINLSLKINPKNTYSLNLKFKIFLRLSPKKAETMLLSVLRNSSDDYKLMLFVNKSYYTLKKYKKVIYMSKEILKLNQNNKNALKLLALAYYYTGSKDLAFYVITKVDELMYQLPELSFIKGLILYENKNFKGAHDSFEEAFNLNPKFFEAGDWLAYLDYKVSLKLKEKEAKNKMLLSSKANYEKIIKLRESAFTYMNYALVLYELNENEEALKYLLKSEDKDKTSYAVYYNLGILYLTRNIKEIDKIKKYDLAVESFEKYNKLLPKKDFKKMNANSLITEAKTAKAIEQAKETEKVEEKAEEDNKDKTVTRPNEEDKEEDKADSKDEAATSPTDDKEDSKGEAVTSPTKDTNEEKNKEKEEKEEKNTDDDEK